MIPTINDILVYLFKNYPNPGELSKARVVKMLYLADWKNCLEYGRQITPIQWYFNHYGPYVDDIVNLIRTDVRFEIEWVSNVFGSPKEIIRLKPNVELLVNIPSENIKTLDFVIKLSSPLYWSDFIDLIYSTYPVRTQPRYTYFNLPKLATEYKAVIASKPVAA